MNEASQSETLARRDFLARAAKAGVAVTATGGLGLWLHDRQGPPATAAGETVALPDFSIPGAGRKLGIVTGADRVKTVNRALQALGGIERFVQRGDRVVLKVNAAFASPLSRRNRTISRMRERSFFSLLLCDGIDIL